MTPGAKLALTLLLLLYAPPIGMALGLYWVITGGYRSNRDA